MSKKENKEDKHLMTEVIRCRLTKKEKEDFKRYCKGTDFSHVLRNLINMKSKIK